MKYLLLLTFFFSLNLNAFADDRYKFVINTDNDFYLFEINIENTISFPGGSILNTASYDALMKFTCLSILNPANAAILYKEYAQSNSISAQLLSGVSETAGEMQQQLTKDFATAGVAFNTVGSPNAWMMYYIVDNMDGTIYDGKNRQVYKKKCRSIVVKQLEDFANLVGAPGDYANYLTDLLKKELNLPF